MKSASKVISFPRAFRRRWADETAFLPAALEIVETPASPVGRATGATIIAVFCIALTWAFFSRIDIVAIAPGKIIPSEGTKVIQPFEIGIVRAIHVRDGQEVQAGQLLIELDPRMNESERDHTLADLTAARLDVARLKAALSNAADPEAAFQPPDDAPADQIAMQREYLVKQIAEYRAKIDALDRQRDQKQAEHDTIQATIEKLSAIVPIVQERVDIRKASSDREYTSKFQYLEMVQMLVEQQRELIVQQNHLHEAEASVAALVEAKSQAVAEYKRTLFGQLAEAERKAGGLAHDAERVRQKINAQYLTAPIAGTVQQLAIHTVGGVVTPAQMLLAVVPSTTRLEIEALISNRDIGFVQSGQPAEIKVDTFNFTKYGLLHGDVLSVSQDAIVRDKSNSERGGDKSLNAESTSSEPKNQELSFSTRVSLDHTQMAIDDKPVNLTPGMAVTVEIKTGSRSVLSYLLSPLIKYRQEGLRER
jgi:membrane fusion protein, hemolysin D